MAEQGNLRPTPAAVADTDFTQWLPLGCVWGGWAEGGTTPGGVRKGTEEVFWFPQWMWAGMLDIRSLGVLASCKDRKIHPPPNSGSTLVRNTTTWNRKWQWKKWWENAPQCKLPSSVPLTLCTGWWAVSCCRWSRLQLQTNRLSWLSRQVEPAPWGNRPRVLCDALSRDTLGHHDHFQEPSSSTGCPEIPSSYLFWDLLFFF